MWARQPWECISVYGNILILKITVDNRLKKWYNGLTAHESILVFYNIVILV